MWARRVRAGYHHGPMATTITTPEPTGWLPTTAALVVVVEGRHDDLLPSNATLGTLIRSSLRPAVAEPGNFILRAGVESQDMFGVRLEWVVNDEARTRIVVRHAAPAAEQLSRMSDVLAGILKDLRSRKVKPQNVGVNFALVHLESPSFAPAKFGRWLAIESGLASAMRGRNGKVVQTIATSEFAGYTSQLQLRLAQGNVLGRSTQVIEASMNYSMVVNTLPAAVKVTSPTELAADMDEFRQVLRRLERFGQ